MCEIELTSNTATLELTAQGNGAPVWGAILGTLSNQTDLQTALNAKANITYVDEQLATKADIATTLAGYGITDAKIDGGVITLGSNTITPITSHQDISGKADLTYVDTQLATKANIATTYTKTEVDTLLGGKQNTLTAGSNVQINGGTISATDTTYTAGTGISIVGNVISNTQTSAEWGNIEGTLSNQTDLQSALDGKYDASNPSGYISGITSTMVTTALGFTPYNATNPNNYQTATQVSTSIAAYHDSTKQDTLTAGANIQINGGTISATDTTYTAGTGISIIDNVISNTQTSAEWGNITGTLSAQTDLMTALNGKQATLIAGTNITIVDNVISATGGGGSATWGSIGGTLSEQTDLQTALNGKQATLPTTSTAGKVLTSTDTQGVVQWGDGGGYVLPEATTTTLGGVIIGNGLNINSGVVSVPSMELDTERSFALPDSIAVPLKAEIKAEVNAGVVTTIGTVMSTDPTVMSKIIKVTPLSTGTFEFLEVNNG